MFKFLFILFLLIPMAELFVLIKIGSAIGAGWTIFFVFATAVLGAFLVKQQGLDTLQRAQITLKQGQAPATEMLEGVALVISGFMLLVPGFITDILGFLLLISPLRQAVVLKLIQNKTIFYRQQSFNQRRSEQQETTIEGEVVDEDDPRHLR